MLEITLTEEQKELLKDFSIENPFNDNTWHPAWVFQQDGKFFLVKASEVPDGTKNFFKVVIEAKYRPKVQGSSE